VESLAAQVLDRGFQQRGEQRNRHNSQRGLMFPDKRSDRRQILYKITLLLTDTQSPAQQIRRFEV
jgi:hypothetical protein